MIRTALHFGALIAVRQPFSYYGGKQKIVRHILPIVESIPHTVFGEPFCGGASVLFAKEPRAVGNGDHYREFINDANEWVTTFYRVGKREPDDLIQLIDETLYSEADHLKAKNILKNSQDHNELMIAWAFYVQANMSFAHIVLRGWGTGVKSESGQKTWDNRKATLPEALNRLSRVAISCGDALSCLKRWDSPQTLFYIDPPYPNTSQGHYEGYSLNDYRQLCDTLDNIKGSYILSNYACDVTPKSVSQSISIETLCSASGKGKTNIDRSQMATQESLGDRTRTETLLICDRSANMRSDVALIAAKELPLEQRIAWLESRVDAIDNRSKRTAAAVEQLSFLDQLRS
jgi:DNA adenine methylase